MKTFLIVLRVLVLIQLIGLVFGVIQLITGPYPLLPVMIDTGILAGLLLFIRHLERNP